VARDGGTTEDDAAAYGKIGGRDGATAACAATPYTAGVAPVCGLVGGYVGEKLGRQLHKWGRKKKKEGSTVKGLTSMSAIDLYFRNWQDTSIELRQILGIYDVFGVGPDGKKSDTACWQCTGADANGRSVRNDHPKDLCFDYYLPWIDTVAKFREQILPLLYANGVPVIGVQVPATLKYPSEVDIGTPVGDLIELGFQQYWATVSAFVGTVAALLSTGQICLVTMSPELLRATTISKYDMMTSPGALAVIGKNANLVKMRDTLIAQKAGVDAFLAQLKDDAEKAEADRAAKLEAAKAARARLAAASRSDRERLSRISKMSTDSGSLLGPLLLVGGIALAGGFVYWRFRK
jgi:hypothetical protein